ncbi:MAG TPA: TolC family protein [Pyrinomonadaceae bacterium]|nr:TolC family protein [Pyrinomonadaceae bacterium]
MSIGTTLKSVLMILLLGGTVLAQNPQEPAPPVAEPLTLERAISLALQDNRPVQNARLEMESYEDRLAALKTKRLPSFKTSALISQPLTKFELTFEKGVFGTFPATGPIPSEDTTITSSMKPTALLTAQATQPISQLYRINLNIKQMELSREIGAEDLRLKQQAVVADVKRAYYAVLQTQGAFESAQSAVKLYKELDRVTGEYVLQEVALKTDQMEVQTKLAKAEYDLLTLNNTLASQKEQLNNLLGRDVRTDFAVTDGLDAAQFIMRETDLAAARERALEQRPEVRKAKLTVGQAKYDKRIKKSERIPEVSLAVNYLSPFGYNSVLPKNVASVGVQVDWEPFDWGRRKREVAEKARVVEQAENSARDVENQVLMEVNSRYRKLQETCQYLRIVRMSQESARATVKLASYRYHVQTVLLKDVLQAQTSLAGADYEYQEALLSFWTAKADFEKALGEDR